MTKTDLQLKQDIEHELLWDPKVNSAQIGVAVDHGTVSLLGVVDTYAEKWAAEDATKRVSGVRSVAQDLTVKVLSEHKRSDSEIAAAVQNALEWDVFVPDTVIASVQEGSVNLSGEVIWNFQRHAAEQAIRHLKGVSGLSNSITLQPRALPAQVREKVQAALERQAVPDRTSIQIETSGGQVTLTGLAPSWQAVEGAANAAWAAPGVTEVVARVKIQ